MANSTIRGSSTMINAIVGTDVGEIITLTGMPAWLPPDDVKMIVQATSKTWTNTWDLTFNCAPESPYEWVSTGRQAPEACGTTPKTRHSPH